MLSPRTCVIRTRTHTARTPPPQRVNRATNRIPRRAEEIYDVRLQQQYFNSGATGMPCFLFHPPLYAMFAHTRTPHAMPCLQSEESYEPYTPLCRGEQATSVDLKRCWSRMTPHNPLHRGLYADQLERWFRVFDRSQVQIDTAVRPGHTVTIE